MTNPADSKVQNVGDILKSFGPNVNWANLALLVFIGWNARDVMNSTFTMVEETVTTVGTLTTDVGSLKREIAEIKAKIAPTVEGNSVEVGRLRAVVEKQEEEIEAMKKCMREGKRKCEV